jgi:hypothetical protein
MNPIRAEALSRLDRGLPLPRRLRCEMEASLRADFSGVRVHLVRDWTPPIHGARAFACGPDLYFGPGQFDPSSPAGRWLIGHELAHIVQQCLGLAAPPSDSGPPLIDDGQLECLADHWGWLATIGRIARPQGEWVVAHRCRAPAIQCSSYQGTKLPIPRPIPMPKKLEVFEKLLIGAEENRQEKTIGGAWFDLLWEVIAREKALAARIDRMAEVSKLNRNDPRIRFLEDSLGKKFKSDLYMKGQIHEAGRRHAEATKKAVKTEAKTLRDTNKKPLPIRGKNTKHDKHLLKKYQSDLASTTELNKSVEQIYLAAMKKARDELPENKRGCYEELGNFLSECMRDVGPQNTIWLLSVAEIDGKVIIALKVLMTSLVEMPHDPKELVRRILQSPGVDKVDFALQCNSILNNGHDFQTGVKVIDNLYEAGFYCAEGNHEDAWDLVGRLAKETESIDTLKDYLQFLRDHQGSLKIAVLVLGSLPGASIRLLRDIVNEKSLKSKIDFRWLLSLPPGSTFQRIVNLISSSPEVVAGLPHLFLCRNQCQDYTDDELLDWAQRYDPRAVALALEVTKSVKKVQFVNRVLLLAGGKIGSMKTVFMQGDSASLINFKTCLLCAQLDDRTITQLNVKKPDRWYKGQVAQRLGFLEAKLGNKETIEIHTHWNIDNMKLVSIHVSEGGFNENDKNGSELFGWQGDIVRLAVAAHNKHKDDMKGPSGPGSKNEDGSENPHDNLKQP